MPDTLTSVFNTIVNRLIALEARPRIPSSFYNLLVNSGFEVWSAGAGPFTANGNECADKWFIALHSGTTISVTEDFTHEDTSYSASCIAADYTGSFSSSIFQTVSGPFTGAASRIALSVRLKTTVANMARIEVDGLFSAYHSGSGQYETLTLVLQPVSSPFLAKIALDASGIVYIDNFMCVQGTAPIDYIGLITSDNQRRIDDY